MTWQENTFYRLRSNPQEWLCLGTLFEEVKSQLPLHAAMRSVYRRYDEIPSGDRAQWLYMTTCLRNMGVERADHLPHRAWGYNDKIRLLRRGTCQCGGLRIRHAFHSPKLVCLDCGDIEDPRWKKKPAQPPKPALTLEVEVVPPPLPPSRPILTLIKNVPPQDQAAHLATGGVPVTQLDKDTYLAKFKGLTVILYKNRMWSVRTLAGYLRTLLPSFSVNRLEQELRRCGYRPALLLQKYNISNDLVSQIIVHNEKLNSTVELIRALQGRK